ncbi:hypothetical protein D3C77_773680 [compost metagenome]
MQKPGAVFGFTGVINALATIRFTATAAKMHHHAEPATLFCRVNQAVGIRAVETAFQTVKQHQTRFMFSLFRIFAPG